MSWIEVTVRLHEDEVKLLPLCLTDDGTYEGTLANGLIAQVIRGAKRLTPKESLCIPTYTKEYTNVWRRMRKNEQT